MRSVKLDKLIRGKTATKKKENAWGEGSDCFFSPFLPQFNLKFSFQLMYLIVGKKKKVIIILGECVEIGRIKRVTFL